MRDMVERGRSFGARDPDGCRKAGIKGGKMNTWAKGEANPKAKLTTKQAAEIQTDARKTKVLAALYGVDRTTIQRIRRGALWAKA